MQQPFSVLRKKLFTKKFDFLQVVPNGYDGMAVTVKIGCPRPVSTHVVSSWENREGFSKAVLLQLR